MHKLAPAPILLKRELPKILLHSPPIIEFAILSLQSLEKFLILLLLPPNKTLLPPP